LKINTAHTVISFLLIAILAFSQVGINFFHSRHDEHSSQGKPVKHSAVHQHRDHCKVCSIDVFNHVFVAGALSFFTLPSRQDTIARREPESMQFATLFTHERAPPITTI
jgi:hypothetical protein